MTRHALAIGILLSAIVAIWIGSALLQFAADLASVRPSVTETRPHDLGGEVAEHGRAR